MRPVDRPRMVCTYCVVRDYTCTVTACGYTRRAQDTARGAAPARNRSCHVVDRSQCSVLTVGHCHAPQSCRFLRTAIAIGRHRSYDIRCDATYGLTEAQKVRARERCVR